MVICMGERRENLDLGKQPQVVPFARVLKKVLKLKSANTPSDVQ